MSEKKFKIREDQIVNLIEPIGGCIASDKITVEGLNIGYMYREEPSFEFDSGWRFFSGTENQDYVDDPENSMIYKVNTIVNYDKTIIPYLTLPIGTSLIKKDDGSFVEE